MALRFIVVRLSLSILLYKNLLALPLLLMIFMLYCPHNQNPSLAASRPTVLRSKPPPPRPSRPMPSLSPNLGEEHLAVGNSAACVFPLIAYCSGRCIAVR
jgi:hypothetical protein